MLIRYEEQSERVGVITLNDPEKLNAMSEAMAKEFSELIRSLSSKPNLRAVILTGAGRAFSAGGDLQMLKKKTELTKEKNKAKMLEYYQSFLCIRELGIPLIAAINGHAIGAGLCLASACDIRICADGAKLGVTFTKLGLHPGMGATYFLPRLIGVAAATELIITGRVIEAKEALRLGLVSALYDSADLMVQASKIAQEVLACGPLAVRQVLETLRGGSDSLSSSLSREADQQSINYASSEFLEGVQSVMEKRPASF